jgi:hypothetical protein
MFDHAWEIEPGGLLVLIGALLLVFTMGACAGALVTKRNTQEQAVAVGAAYWAAGKDGSVQFKYITE